MTVSPPLTRREVRAQASIDLALVPACDVPLTRRAIREAADRGHRGTRGRPTARQIVRAVPLGQQAAAIAVGLALAGGVATLATASPIEPGAGVATTAISTTRVDADAAAAARLTGQAAAYALRVQAEAADTGRLALTRLDAVRTAAVEAGTAADLTGLETTTTQLAALLTQAGVVVEPVELPESTEVTDPEPVAAGTPSPAVPEAAPTVAAALPAPTVPETVPPEPTPTTSAPLATETPTPIPTPAPVPTPAPSPSVTGELAELDAAVRILALAEQAEGLAAAVQAEIDATVAAAQALVENVAEVESHDNGAIPVDLLCAPEFAPDTLLRCDAVEALEELNVAFAEEFGEDMDVISGYRDYATQVATRYRRGGLAARPGTSNHGLGLAIDVADFGRLGYFGAPHYEWMADNAEAYGWFHPDHMGPGGSGPREPWHWEFDPALLLGAESTPLPGVD